MNSRFSEQLREHVYRSVHKVRLYAKLMICSLAIFGPPGNTSALLLFFTSFMTVRSYYLKCFNYDDTKFQRNLRTLLNAESGSYLIILSLFQFTCWHNASILLDLFPKGVPFHHGYIYATAIVLCAIITTMHYTMEFCGSGKIPKNVNVKTIMEKSGFDVSDWFFCKKCNEERPRFTVHCRYCDTCTIDFDHHC